MGRVGLRVHWFTSGSRRQDDLCSRTVQIRGISGHSQARVEAVLQRRARIVKRGLSDCMVLGEEVEDKIVSYLGIL